jgi:hypothetical protein
MLCSEVMAVCSKTHTKHINALCGQKVCLVKSVYAYSNHIGTRQPIHQHSSLSIAATLCRFFDKVTYGDTNLAQVSELRFSARIYK